MDSLTIGVALITYNGIKYLPQQLESIATQTRPVHHIVISDDRSTDGTWAFLDCCEGPFLQFVATDWRAHEHYRQHQGGSAHRRRLARRHLT